MSQPPTCTLLEPARGLSTSGNSTIERSVPSDDGEEGRTIDTGCGFKAAFPMVNLMTIKSSTSPELSEGMSIG